MDERVVGVQTLNNAVTGCTLAFIPADPVDGMYQPLSALAVLAGLNACEFSGVCECYLRPSIEDGEYLMGVGLEFAGSTPDETWWGALASSVQHACDDDEDIRLDRDRCEFTTVGELRESMVHAGTAGFEGGVAVWVSDPLGPDPKSPFTVMCRNAR